MKTLKLMIATAILFASMAVNGQKKDSLFLVKPIAGIDDGYILSRFSRTMGDSAKEVLFVSTTPNPSGYAPIRSWKLLKDTVGGVIKHTITTTLAPISLWIKLIHISQKGDTLVETGTVTILPKAQLGYIGFVNNPYNKNGKIFANLSYKSNRDGEIIPYRVFDPRDTTSAIPFASWSISGKSTNQTRIDSIFSAGSVDYWICYAIKNGAGVTKTKWMFVPAFTAPRIPGMWIDTLTPKSNTDLYSSGIIDIGGQNTNYWLLIDGSKTPVMTMTTSGWWNYTFHNLLPGNHTIQGFVQNAKGKDSTKVYNYKMVQNIKPSFLGIIDFYINGLSVTPFTLYSIPAGRKGSITIEYDSDSTFGFPKEWKNITGVSGNGKAEASFNLSDKGLYYARITYTDNDTTVIRKRSFNVWPLSVQNFASKQISVYPNPTKDVLHSSEPIALFNSLGEKVREGADFFVSDLPRGLYFYYSTLNQNIISGKVMLE